MARITSKLALVLLAGLVLAGCYIEGPPPGGAIVLLVTDGETGEPTPARVELLDDRGQAHIADNALRVAGDCGWLPIHNWFRWYTPIQMGNELQARVPNPYTGTDQFYVDRPIRIDVPPGRYRIRVFKGIEYEVETREVEVARGTPEEIRIELRRWIDLPAEGWYSADDHLHIPRAHPEYDGLLATWMRAEDLHVANMLQMGLSRELHLSPQFGFGKPTIYRDGNTVLASGQENPRTHVLGHSIILGAEEWIDYPESYLAYDKVWNAAGEQGGLRGYAHWGLGGADEGLAVWGHEGTLDFLEVLGFGLPYYEAWYDMLDLGLRVTPTAGTDYPCAPGLPGRERFYTKLDGSLDYLDWIEQVRAGRTFVTNGPILELSVGETIVGGELQLDAPGRVPLVGRVRFDPGRDAVERLELVVAGEVVHVVERGEASGEIRMDLQLDVDRSSWIALRASGTKVGEEPVEGIELLEGALTYLERKTSVALLEGATRALPLNGAPRPSAAHTAPIWVSVAGTPPIEDQPRAGEVARRWLALLDELEGRFTDEGIAEMAGFPGRGDGVDADDLHAGRPDLLRAIERSREILDKR